MEVEKERVSGKDIFKLISNHYEGFATYSYIAEKVS
jgi:hypothetical protein